MLLRRANVRAVVKLAAPAFALLAVAGAMACGTEAVGVDSCRQIETARCENARSCGIDLTTPVHRGDTPSDDVGACKRYYDDACLHGLAAPTDPGTVAVQACIDAINEATDCEIVKSPEKSPACAFLVPPAPAPVEVVDAATTATDAAAAD
jgi:hypothetical protein